MHHADSVHGRRRRGRPLAAMLAAAVTLASPSSAQDRCALAQWADNRLGWSEAIAAAGDLSPGTGLRWLTPRRDRVVLLIHGLDDTGNTFDTLIESLTASTDGLGEPVGVAVFEYPNDQSIEASSATFSMVLEALPSGGATRVDIVGHSMGGLVALDAIDAASSGGLDPSVIGRVVTIGTPYAGSPIARIRPLGEARELAVRWWRSDEAPWTALLGVLDDGDGQAGRDLRPGSDYFARGGGGYRPEGGITIVVGRPLGEPAPVAAAHPSWWRPSGWWTRAVWAWQFASGSLATAIGDGAVPEASALAGADQDVVFVEDWHGRLAHHPATQTAVLDRLELRP